MASDHDCDKCDEQENAGGKHVTEEEKMIPVTARGTDVVVALCTVVIAACTIVTSFLTSSQLDEVRASAVQADKLANAAVDQAKAAQSLAELMRDDFRAKQRARIIPTDMQAIGSTSGGMPIQIAVGFINVGLDAATEFNVETYAFFAEKEKWSSAEYTAQISQMKDQCMSKSMRDFGPTIFPGAESGKRVGLDFSKYGTLQSEAMAWSDNVRLGNDVIVIPGCMTYRSLDETHHTFFCYYSLQDQTGVSEVNFAHCEVGHRAD